MQAVDIATVFKNLYSQEELMNFYYKTDHHWNIDGAFAGYKIIADTLAASSQHFVGDNEDLSESNYSRACIQGSNTFQGSYNRQLYMRIDAKDDNENMCIMNRENVYENYLVKLGEKTKTEPFELYARGLSNDEKDIFTYSNIFTADHAEINIINQKKVNAGNVLVIKDSYTNPIIYHMAQNYYRTTIYDPRHNSDRTISSYIKENDFDTVIVLSSSVTLNENNFNWE